ncbi:hypothetical protein [Defluviitalea saccharophila]|uniref:Uncharacterized protein n=1 Tax=Defluviitalea saccharophila TaxID=879970 RepID=A0ABZ2Y6P1_9FIRM
MSQLLQCIFGKLLDFAFDVLRPNVTNSDSPRVPIRFTSSSEEKYYPVLRWTFMKKIQQFGYLEQ